MAGACGFGRGSSLGRGLLREGGFLSMKQAHLILLFVALINEINQALIQRSLDLILNPKVS